MTAVAICIAVLLNTAPAHAGIGDRLFRQMHRERVVNKKMKTMTTRQKVAQLIMAATEVKYVPGEPGILDTLVGQEQIGGFMILRKDSLKTAAGLTEHLQSISRDPLLVSIDGEWGMAMRIYDYPAFPRQEYLGHLDDEDMVYRMGRSVAEEMKNFGVAINCAPVIDVNNNPDNTVIGTRSFSDDPEVVSRLGIAYMKGMMDGGVIPCVKHFPGHGDTSVDSHKALPVIPHSRERLDSIELRPFRDAIAAGAPMVMVGHLSVPALDPSGVPASISEKIIKGVLKEELGFRGLVITDALNMSGVLDFCDGSGPKAALAAYKAGVDILLMPVDPVGCIDLIESAVLSGEVDIDDLNARVRRILELKADLGMFDRGYRRSTPLEEMDPNISAGLVEEINELVNS